MKSIDLEDQSLRILAGFEKVRALSEKSLAPPVAGSAGRPGMESRKREDAPTEGRGRGEIDPGTSPT